MERKNPSRKKMIRKIVDFMSCLIYKRNMKENDDKKI